MTTMRVVGECFFWYRLTRVFPDKFHRAVKRLCVCVFCVAVMGEDRNQTLIVTSNKSQHMHTQTHTRTHTHNHFMALWILSRTARVMVPEETFTHSHTCRGRQSSHQMKPVGDFLLFTACWKPGGRPTRSVMICRETSSRSYFFDKKVMDLVTDPKKIWGLVKNVVDVMVLSRF